MITSVKIERYREYDELMRVVSHNEACPATNKDLIQPLHYHMLIGTHVPEQYQYELGALVVALFRSFTVVDVEIWQTDAGLWIADALVEFGDRRRLRKGEGETPLEAMINLIYDIQRY